MSAEHVQPSATLSHLICHRPFFLCGSRNKDSRLPGNGCHHSSPLFRSSHCHSFSLGVSLQYLRFWMSSRHSLSQQQQPCHLDDPYMTPFLFKYGARQPFRTRPRRVIFFLFAIAFVSIILFSQHHVLVEHAQPHHASLDPQTLLHDSLPPSTITVTAPPAIQTAFVEPPVEPVVFALVMYSESSAKEGAILLKVPSSLN
jgi:hypothetical protein